MSRSTVQSIPLQLVVPARRILSLTNLVTEFGTYFDTTIKIPLIAGNSSAGNPYRRAGIGTIDLLVYTHLDLLLLIIEILILFPKAAILMWRLTVLNLPLQQEFPGFVL
jgi:hypothetical protein